LGESVCAKLSVRAGSVRRIIDARERTDEPLQGYRTPAAAIGCAACGLEFGGDRNSMVREFAVLKLPREKTNHPSREIHQWRH
jgi:hypothetical protein